MAILLALLAALTPPPPAGKPEEVAAVLRLHERQCNQIDSRRCFELGRAYEDGLGVTASLPAALALFEMACENDDGRACLRIAFRHELGDGAELDFARAVFFYAKACEAGGIAPACSAAGILFEKIAALHNPVRAAELYERACEGRVGSSCLHLAQMLEVGRDLPPDPARVRDLRGRACFLGRREACAKK